MKLGIQTGKVNKTFSDRVQEIAKAGVHKYVKREGTPGNYKYWYRLPDGSIGTKEELKAAENGKKEKEGHKPTVAKEDGKKRLGIRKPDSGGKQTASNDEKLKSAESTLIAYANRQVDSKTAKERLASLGFTNEASGAAIGYTYHSSGNRSGLNGVIKTAKKFLIDELNNKQALENDEKRQKTKPFNELSPNEANYVRLKGEDGKKKLFQERAEKWYEDGLLNREEAIEKLVSMGGLDRKIAEGRVDKWDRNLSSSSKENNGESATDVRTGDNVSGVDIDGKQVSGKVTGVGTHGVTIDHKHQVEHENVKKQEKVKTDNESKKKETNPEKQKTFIPPENFNAAEWSKQWDDPKATPDERGVDYILKSFGKEGQEIAEKIVWAQTENKKFKTDKKLTTDIYDRKGEGVDAIYSAEREALHGRILQNLLDPDKIRMAKPEPGKQPTLLMLGGRGGSGKSWFKIDPEKNPGGGIYDPHNFVILDADSIKEQLKPEYKGWNAFQVHDESSDILEQAIDTCVKMGLNVVIDMTMKTPASAIERLKTFIAKGYKTEAHYMHLPRQEAAKRAIGRYKDGGEKGQNGEPAVPYTGRFVPVDTILDMTNNEKTFEMIKPLVENWSFRDNNVKRGEPPILISEGKNNVKKSYAALVKSIVRLYN